MGILKIMGLLCIAIMGLGLGLSLVMPVAATEEATTWELELAGALDDTISNSGFEDCMGCHGASYTDFENNEWEGVPLWYLMGDVDDTVTHGSGAFNDAIAADGYDVKIIAGDGYSSTLDSTYLAENDSYIVACYLNGTPLPELTDDGKPLAPLKLVGPYLSGGQKVGNIARIELDVAVAPPQADLTLIGSETKVYSLDEVKAMPAYTASGGFKKSTGVIVGPYTYTGVNLTYLTDLVGGISPSNSIKLTASDGYSMTYTYDQVMGDITIYSTNEEETDEPLTMVLAYEEDGASIPDEFGGPLRVAFIRSDIPITDGHFWVKYVNKIEIFGSVDEWDLTLTGAITDITDRSTFESCVGCHGVDWTDDSDQNWRGIPLWLLVGVVDDDVNEESKHYFNDAVADQGYNVTVIASDGYSKTFSSAFVKRNNNILLVNELNGIALPETDWPLKFTGSDLANNENVKQVVEIQLNDLPPSSSPPSSTLTATANVNIQMVGISLNRTEIDYGNVRAGLSSENEYVRITNIGSSYVDVTLEADGESETAQNFYEQSLFVNNGLYNPATIIANIATSNSEDVVTQLRVPFDWNEAGTQGATFVFWAEA